MTESHLLPPAPESCLDRSYSSSQKGGTLIAEDVLDLDTHTRRLRSPGSYRPAKCRRCGSRIHIHDLRPRLLLADVATATEIVRFRCAERLRCGAVWQVLPAFLARHLWRRWTVVDQALGQRPEHSEVPPRTRRRWRARLDSAARVLVAALTTAIDSAECSVAIAVGLDATRRDLLDHYRALAPPVPGASIAMLAAAVHRLSPGLRLM